MLLAIVDTNYKFIAIDVGSYGKEGDSQIFKKSEMGKKILSNAFNFPEPKPLPGTNDILPHFLIEDEAFALDTFVMKPYILKELQDMAARKIFITTGYVVLGEWWKMLSAYYLKFSECFIYLYQFCLKLVTT